jgi:hypothetical protein
VTTVYHQFAAHIERLGLPRVVAALGWTGGDGYGVDDFENLSYAFENLPTEEQEQALRVLAMTRY